MLSEYMQQNDANAFYCTLILNQKLESFLNLSSHYQLNLKLSFFTLDKPGEQVEPNFLCIQKRSLRDMYLLRSRSKQHDYEI